MNLYARYLIIYLFCSALVFMMLPIFNAYQHQWDIRLNDTEKLFSTDLVERYINFKFYQKGFSRNYPSAIVGKEGWIFLGNAYDEILKQTRNVGSFWISPRNIAAAISTMKQRQNWLNANGFPNLYVISPNKHSIYPEYLPDWIAIPDNNSTDKVVKTVQAAGVHLIDLRGNLIIKKQNQFVYHRYDTHWNNLGAFFAYEIMLAELNKITSTPIISIKNVTYTQIKIEQYILAVILKIEALIPKDFGSDYQLEYQGKQDNICVQDMNNDDFTLTGHCKEQKNGSISINFQAKLVTNPKALNKLSVLWLRDSFGDAVSPLFQSTFSKIYSIHHNKLTGIKLQQFILKHQPDIVLYQVAERLMLHPSMQYNFE